MLTEYKGLCGVVLVSLRSGVSFVVVVMLLFL